MISSYVALEYGYFKGLSYKHDVRATAGCLSMREGANLREHGWINAWLKALPDHKAEPMEKQSPWTLVPIVDEASDTGGLMVSHQPSLRETHVRWRAAALQHASLTCIGRARVMA